MELLVSLGWNSLFHQLETLCFISLKLFVSRCGTNGFSGGNKVNIMFHLIIIYIKTLLR